MVNGWMRTMGSDGLASPPSEQDHSIIDRLETRRIAHQRSQATLRRRRLGRSRNVTERSFSVASDPEDTGAGSVRLPRPLRRQESSLPDMSIEDAPQTEVADADVTPSRYEEARIAIDRLVTPLEHEETGTEQEDYFQQTPRARPPASRLQSSRSAQINKEADEKPASPMATASPRRQRQPHNRNISTTTILYDPQPIQIARSVNVSPPGKRDSARNTKEHSPQSSTQSTPRQIRPVRPRPIMPPRTAFQSAPNLAGMLRMASKRPQEAPLAFDIGSDLGDNKAVGGGFVGAFPGSFNTQLGFNMSSPPRLRRQDTQGRHDDQQRMSKLMLARMNTLEEGFREVLNEVRDWKRERTGEATETKSLDGSDLVEMKIGRPSKGLPLKGAGGKGKMRFRVLGPDDQPTAEGFLEESPAAKGSSV